MATPKPVFKSKKAKEVYDIICSLPPLSEAQAKQMVDAIEKWTGRRHSPGRSEFRNVVLPASVARQLERFKKAYDPGWDEHLVKLLRDQAKKGADSVRKSR